MTAPQRGCLYAFACVSLGCAPARHAVKELQLRNGIPSATLELSERTPALSDREGFYEFSGPGASRAAVAIFLGDSALREARVTVEVWVLPEAPPVRIE